MKKLDLNALDALFSYLNKPGTIFWLRDKTYQKQIYISPSFEDIWGISCAALYEDHEATLIKSTLLEDPEAKNWVDLDHLKENIGKENIVDTQIPTQETELLLRIKTPQGTQRYIQDSHFLLVDNEGRNIGFAGIAEELTSEQWHAKYYAKKNTLVSPNDDLFKKYIFDLLKAEAGVNKKADFQLLDPNQQLSRNNVPTYIFKTKNYEIVFTKRESQCIEYLRQGLSAKQTADLLCLSARTVEFHLNNAKDKAGCRNKLELATKVIRKTR